MQLEARPTEELPHEEGLINPVGNAAGFQATFPMWVIDRDISTVRTLGCLEHLLDQLELRPT